MMASEIFDVVVIGGGPVGLAATYEVAKAKKSVLVLEKNNFFNQAGSSGDLARMFRTMYTEDFMADLAVKAMGHWDELEKDAGLELRWMSGLLNFGDPNIGGGTPEGGLLEPIPNLERHNMKYEKWDAETIEARYPFKNLDKDWVGLYAPDNGVINVQQLLRTLFTLAKSHGAKAKQHTKVERIVPSAQDPNIWEVHTTRPEGSITYAARKIVITCGSFVNHVLKPSFGLTFDLDIWEMTACYFNVNAGPDGPIFPSMWFQFAPDKEDPTECDPKKKMRSQLFYGMPALPWGPPNVVRIAVDAARRRIPDPEERESNVFNPKDIRDTQEFVRNHTVGIDASVPASTISCLQTNVFDNMFVLDYVPQEYLGNGPEKSVVVFTAGWAMKFVPLLGKALKELALDGHSDYALKQFSMTRKNDDGSKGIIKDSPGTHTPPESQFEFDVQAKGSSCRGTHNTVA